MKSQLRIPFYLTLKYLQRGRKWTLFFNPVFDVRCLYKFDIYVLAIYRNY